MPALCYDCYKQQACDAKTDKVQQTDTIAADRRWKIKPTNPTEIEIFIANGHAFEWIFKHAFVELVFFFLGNAYVMNEFMFCFGNGITYSSNLVNFITLPDVDAFQYSLDYCVFQSQISQFISSIRAHFFPFDGEKVQRKNIAQIYGLPDRIFWIIQKLLIDEFNKTIFFCQQFHLKIPKNICVKQKCLYCNIVCIIFWLDWPIVGPQHY